MRTIDIGISHNNNLMITKFTDIKIFMNSCSESCDHSFDLCICINLIQTCFLYIQDLTSQWKDSLCYTISGCFCRATGGISLYNEYLTPGGIPALAVCQLAVAVKGEFGPGQHVGLGFFLSPANLG